MTEKAIQLTNFGDRAEVKELSERLQIMMPGGSKYTEREALTLAQIAVAHDLDPFNGEVWLIKNEKTNEVLGALIGIKGHRKHAKREANYWGYGQDGGFTRIIDPKKLEQYGATVGDIVFEYRIMDEKNLESYTANLERFTSMGIPLNEAQKMVGPPPVTLGIGVYTKGEKTKMKPVQCAMFRAEKDALKRRFDVKFRIEINSKSLPVQTADFEDEPHSDEIEAEYEELNGDEPKDADEIVEELGYDQFEGKATTTINGNTWPTGVVQAVILAGYSENKHATVGALKKSNLDPDTVTKEIAVTWMKIYRGWRDADKSSDEAAELANKGEVPK